jgi:hypothetical protein
VTNRRDRHHAADVSDKTDKEAAYEREAAEIKRNAQAIADMDAEDRRRMEERRNERPARRWK